MNKTRLVKTGITIPQNLLVELENIANMMGIRSRSVAIQMAVRQFIASMNIHLRREGKLAGAIIVHYSHKHHHIEEILTEIQHNYLDIIPASMHIHLSHDDCMLVIGLKGDSDRIKKFVEELNSKAKTKHVLVSLTPI